MVAQCPRVHFESSGQLMSKDDHQNFSGHLARFGCQGNAVADHLNRPSILDSQNKLSTRPKITRRTALQTQQLSSTLILSIISNRWKCKIENIFYSHYELTSWRGTHKGMKNKQKSLLNAIKVAVGTTLPSPSERELTDQSAESTLEPKWKATQTLHNAISSQIRVSRQTLII